MPERRKLEDAEIEARLAEIPGWSHAEGALQRTFQFGDFVAAFGFMSSVALAAEKLDHHPNWSNVYNSVNIALDTHDADGITDFDFTLAARISEIAGS